MLKIVVGTCEKGGSTLLMQTIVQVSLDLRSIPEALALAHIAVAAGVDWLEAGTPLVLSEGRHGVSARRDAFPAHPVVADLKAMDGGRSGVLAKCINGRAINESPLHAAWLHQLASCLI